MKRHVFSVVAIASTIVWVACGQPNKNGNKITHNPNNKKVTGHCPTELGQFKAGSEIIELKNVDGAIEIRVNGELRARTGPEEFKLNDQLVSAGCLEGVISVETGRDSNRLKMEYKIVGNNLQMTANGESKTATRVGAVVRSNPTNGIRGPRVRPGTGLGTPGVAATPAIVAPATQAVVPAATQAIVPQASTAIVQSGSGAIVDGTFFPNL